MFNSYLDRDFVEKTLRFANLPETGWSSRDVEGIFEDHPYISERSPLWLKIPDPNDVDGLKGLRETLRGWLRTIASGQWEDAVKVRDEALKRYTEKATLQAKVEFTTLDGHQGALPLRMWGLTQLAFDEDGRLVIGATPFITGVESAVYFAVILIFASDAQGGSIGICPAPLPREKGIIQKRQCGNFFLRTKERWRTCSEQCNKNRRRAYVNEKVRDYWKENPRAKKAKGRAKR